MAAREKNPSLPPPLSFAPLGQAVMETFSEGVVVFDSYGRMLYANQRARRTIDALGDGAAHRGENVRERLVAFGGGAKTLKEGALDPGEGVVPPGGGDSPRPAGGEGPALLPTPPARPRKRRVDRRPRG